MFHRAGTIEVEFTRLGEKLDALVAKAEDGASDAGDEAQKRVANLKAKRQSVREKLDELREAGDDEWDILKGGITSAWTELESAFAEMSD